MKVKFYIIIFMLSLFCSSLMSEDFNRSTQTFFIGKISLLDKPLVSQFIDVRFDLYSINDDCFDLVIKFRVPEGISITGDRTFKENSIVKGTSKVYLTRIQVEKEGAYAIQASVYSRLRDGKHIAEHFFTYLIVDKTSSQVHDKIGFLSSAKNGISARIGSHLAPTERQTSPPNKFNLYGNIKYFDDNLSQEMPIKKITVQLYEVISDKKIFIASEITDESGFYVFENINLNEAQKTHDLQLSIVFENDILRLIDNTSNIYKFDAPIIRSVSGSMNCDYCMNESNQYRGLAHIFNTIVDAYDFLKNRLNWSRKKINVRYPYQSDLSYYNYLYKPFSGNIYNECINIATSRQWVRTSMLHEYGHSVMTALYNYNYYDLPKKTVYLESHSINSISDKGFAMREGWAEFFEALVEDNAFNITHYNGVNITNIEYNDWWKGNDRKNTRGETVEGAVASILWDIADTDKSIDEKIGVDDDNISDGVERIFDLVSRYKPNDIVEFWDHWINNGYGWFLELYSIYINNGVNIFHPYDINKDGEVDHRDIKSLISHFGKRSGRHDINSDGIVNITDLLMINRTLHNR